MGFGVRVCYQFGFRGCSVFKTVLLGLGCEDSRDSKLQQFQEPGNPRKWLTMSALDAA